MEIWSATLRGDGRPHTFLGRVFAALEGRQRDYDFLLAGVEACPTRPEHAFVNRGPVWLSGEELTALEEEQSQWESSLDGQVEGLRAQTGDSPDGAVTVARQIVELYRQRAKALCQTAYEATGEMPSFQSEDPVG